jgi:hypothetical protein
MDLFLVFIGVPEENLVESRSDAREIAELCNDVGPSSVTTPGKLLHVHASFSFSRTLKDTLIVILPTVLSSELFNGDTRPQRSDGTRTNIRADSD